MPPLHQRRSLQALVLAFLTPLGRGNAAQPLPKVLTDDSRAQVVVLADAWFARKGFLEGVYARGYRAVVAIRADRRTVQGEPWTSCWGS